MPSAVSRPIVPFVGERFDPRTRLGDYARSGGRDVAEAMRQNAALSGQMWRGIGENVSGSLRDIAAYPAQQRQAAMFAQKQQREEQAYQEQQTAKQAEAAKQARLKELVQEHGGRVPTERLLQEFGPEDTAHIVKAFDDIFPKPKEAEPYTLNPGDQRRGGDNAVLAENPKPEPVEKTPAVGSFEDYVVRRFGPMPKPEQIEAARKAYQQADDRPITVNTGQPRPLTQTAEAQIIQRLSNQWTTANKPMKDLDRQIGLMDAGMKAVDRGDRAQGDQTILVTFQKILDPPSVVRESEYMRSAAGQSLMNRVQAAFQQLQTGGAKMLPAELKKFAELAREAAVAQRKAANIEGIQKRLGLTADRYNIPRELVFEDVPAVETVPAASPKYLSSDPNFGTPVAPVKPKGGR